MTKEVNNSLRRLDIDRLTSSEKKMSKYFCQRQNTMEKSIGLVVWVPLVFSLLLCIFCISNKLSYMKKGHIWLQYSKDLDVISSMAYKGSYEKKPTEIFKENIALTEKNQELNRKLARARTGDVEESYEEHDVSVKVTLHLNFNQLVNLAQNWYF